MLVCYQVVVSGKVWGQQWCVARKNRTGLDNVAYVYQVLLKPQIVDHGVFAFLNLTDNSMYYLIEYLSDNSIEYHREYLTHINIQYLSEYLTHNSMYYLSEYLSDIIIYFGLQILAGVSTRVMAKNGQ